MVNQCVGALELCRPATANVWPRGAKPFVDSEDDSYDNALAETVNGLYTVELIHRLAPRKVMEFVELATLEWVSWFDHYQQLESIGYIPPPKLKTITIGN